jgi:hypothetical protein
MEEWRQHYGSEQWRDVLAFGIAHEALRSRIREATAAGKPLGNQEFIRRLAEDLSRNMEIRRRGRPAGTRSSAA